MIPTFNVCYSGCSNLDIRFDFGREFGFDLDSFDYLRVFKISSVIGFTLMCSMVSTLELAFRISSFEF